MVEAVVSVIEVMVVVGEKVNTNDMVGVTR